jgi:hypothetical protein
MKNKNNFIIPFLGARSNKLNGNLLFLSVAIGASVGYYLLKKFGSKKPQFKPQSKWDSSINDMRTEIKNSTKSLLGDYDDNHDPIKINVPEAGTLAWKKNRDRSMFPPIPDPNIKIN